MPYTPKKLVWNIDVNHGNLQRTVNSVQHKPVKLEMMKKFLILGTLMIGAVVLLNACSKDFKAAKDLEGDWTIVSYNDSQYNIGQTVSGSFTFDDCKKKDNKDEACSGNIDYKVILEFTQSTQTIEVNSDIEWGASDKGDKLKISGDDQLDIEFDMDLDEDDLTLTSTNLASTLTIVLKR